MQMEQMANEIGSRQPTGEIAQSKEVEHTVSRAANLHRGRSVRCRGARQDKILRVDGCWRRGDNLGRPPTLGSSAFAVAFSRSAGAGTLNDLVFDLELIAVEKTLYVDTSDRQQLLLRDGSHSLQLDFRGTPLTQPVTLLVDTAVPEDRPEIQLHLLQCFRELRASGTLPAHCFAPHLYAKRASVLKALGGYLAGIGHRDIAIAMFGGKSVDHD